MIGLPIFTGVTLDMIGMSITIGDWLKSLGINWFTNPYW